LVVFIVRSGLSLAGYNGNLVMVVLGSVLIAGVVLNELASKGFGRDVRRYEK
jgi:ribose transport system permease protein/ribose transport system ATP-binding protein